MRWLKRYVRPLDYVIVVLLFIACFIPAGIFSLTEANVNTSQKVAVISVNGQVKRRIKLGAHTRHQQFTLYPAKVSTISLKLMVNVFGTKKIIRLTRLRCILAGLVALASRVFACRISCS